MVAILIIILVLAGLLMCYEIYQIVKAIIKKRKKAKKKADQVSSNNINQSVSDADRKE